MHWFDKALITILVVVGSAGLVTACNKAPPRDEQQVQADLKKMSEDHRARRQSYMDEASVVCRDGTAYLVGDTGDSWNYGGPFAVPYYRNGALVLCGANNFGAQPQTKKEV